MRKKYLSIILSLVMVFTISACSNNNKSEEPSITDVAGLISRLDTYQKNKEEEKKLAEEREQEKTLKEAKKNELKEKDAKAKIDQKALEERAKEEIAKEDEKKPRIKKVKLKAFGDIMAHMVQIQYGNYETTTNPNLPYAGFPRFNAPAAYLRDLKDTGFDIVSTANNHSMDTEIEGVLSTMDSAKEAGLDYVGSFKDKTERILYKEVKGIKFAFLAYTYGCNGRENLVIPREEVENKKRYQKSQGFWS